MKLYTVFQNSISKSKLVIISVLLVCLILFSFRLPVSASTYSCGTYGAGEYSQHDECLEEAEPDGLFDTGQAISIASSVALILTGSGLLIYFVRKKNNASKSK